MPVRCLTMLGLLLNPGIIMATPVHDLDENSILSGLQTLKMPPTSSTRETPQYDEAFIKPADPSPISASPDGVVGDMSGIVQMHHFDFCSDFDDFASQRLDIPHHTSDTSDAFPTQEGMPQHNDAFVSHTHQSPNPSSPAARDDDGQGVSHPTIQHSGCHSGSDGASTRVLNHFYLPSTSDKSSASSTREITQGNEAVASPTYRSPDSFSPADLMMQDSPTLEKSSKRGQSIQSKKYKKKKYKTAVPAENDCDSFLVFSSKLMDFEPSTPSKQVAFEALLSLKKADGSALIDPDLGKDRKMIVLQLSRLGMQKDFLLFAYKTHWSEKNPCRTHSDDSNGSLRGSKIKSTTILAAIRKLHPSNNPKIGFYAGFLLKDLDQKKRNLEEQVQAKFCHGRDDYTLKKRLLELKWIIKILPAYLFHVEMISIIIPNGNLENSASIETQRKTDGHKFFELIERVLMRGSESVINFSDNYGLKISLSLFIDFFKEDITKKGRSYTYLWKALHYWMLTSRRDLLRNSKEIIDGPSKSFKVFFNDLLISWVELQER